MGGSALAGQIASEVRFDHSSVRLLQGAAQEDQLQAGLEIKLPGNWKTYWRVPGDAGVPPDFNWSNSTNLSKVEISWPAPQRYVDKAGESIGYKHHVVFPLRITPINPSEPVKLDLRLFYAVCDDICIPGKVAVGIELTKLPVDPADAALIAQFIQKVPVASSHEVDVRDIRVEHSGGNLALAVEVSNSNPDDEIDIFVAGIDTAYVRKPILIRNDGSNSTYHLIVDGVNSADELKARSFDVVVTSGEAALVRHVTLK